MDEREWLSTLDPNSLVHSLRGRRASERKLRLFAVACCRLVWDCLTEPRSRTAVEVAERYADGAATYEEMFAAGAAVREILDEAPGKQRSAQAAAAVEATRGPANLQADLAAWGPAQVYASHLAGSTPRSDWLVSHFQAWESARGAKRAETARLFRHILGNPYRPYPAPAAWPAPVVALAQALYEGEKCHFAMHDTLLGAGHPELAEHFREEFHPKGCFALDLILGKQ